NQQQIFLPITRLRYINDKWAYIWAIDLTYHHKDDDPLKGYSVKFGLDRLVQDQLDQCVNGDGTGLSFYFNNNNDLFKGFDVGTGIAIKDDLQTNFDRSVRQSFADYYKAKFGDKQADPHACENALRSMRQIVSSAALMNG